MAEREWRETGQTMEDPARERAQNLGERGRWVGFPKQKIVLPGSPQRGLEGRAERSADAERRWVATTGPKEARRRRRNGLELGDKGREVIRGAAGMVCLTENMMDAEKTNARTSHNPCTKSVPRERVRVRGKRVNLIPVHQCEDEE